MKIYTRTLIIAAWAAIAVGVARADVVTTGDMNNVTYGSQGGTLTWNPFLVNPTGTETMDVKFGLWDGTSEDIAVWVNSTWVGDLTADHGYIIPGPEFASFDISGLLIDGWNTITFVGDQTQDYLIGRVDLTFDSSTSRVPDGGSTLSLLGFAVATAAVFRRKFRRA